MTSGEHSESANLRQGQNLTGVIVFHGGGAYVETSSKVAEDGTTRKNTYDFLLVFYSNVCRISYHFCATVDVMPK